MSQAPIVVGVAPTLESAAALDWAVEEARMHDRPLHLLHAVGDELAAWVQLQPDDVAGVVSGLLADGERMLARARERVRARAPGVEVRTEVVQARRAEALRAGASGADTLVIGNHDAGGRTTPGLDVLEPFLRTGLACPVVAVPRTGAGSAILALADGSPASAETLAYAFRQAELRGLRLRVVLCLPDPSPTAGSAELHLMDTVERLEEAAGPSLIGFERRVLHDRVAHLRQRHPGVPVDVVDEAPAVDEALARSVREGDVLVADAGHSRRVLDLVDGTTSATLAAVTVLLPRSEQCAGRPGHALPPDLPGPLPGPVPASPLTAPVPAPVPAPELLPVRVLRRYADDPDVR